MEKYGHMWVIKENKSKVMKAFVQNNFIIIFFVSFMSISAGYHLIEPGCQRKFVI